MIPNDSGLILVNLAAVILCTVFVTYVVVIVTVYYRSKERPVLGDAEAFEWHILVPCLDEEVVIGRTVTDLVAVHTRAHVWCIDDASTDNTRSVIAELVEAFDTVHLVARQCPEARTGKGDALNAGWAAVTDWCRERVDRAEPDHARVIVGVVDADGRLSGQALAHLAGDRFFADDEVGAVQLAVRMGNRTAAEPVPGTSKGEQLLVDLQDLEFVGPIAAMQLLRERTGSVAMGGNGQFTRLSVLDAIAEQAGSPWHGALLEDFELGIHVLLAGHRTAYCHDASVEQEALPRMGALVRQRSRWAQGAMQCRRYLGPVLASENISNVAAFEICYFLLLPWIQLLGTAVYLASYAVLAWYLSGAAGAAPDASVWLLVPLIVAVGLGPFVLWGPLYRLRAEPSTSRRRAWALGLANWAFTALHHASTWWAFGRVVRRRHDWKKTARNATDLSNAVAHPAPDDGRPPPTGSTGTCAMPTT
ncbi:MAG: glycosyltransferase family 2 protein [Aquihabitans sp.]